MTKATVDPGICGLKTVLSIESEDMQNVVIKIESQCPYITKMGKELEILGQIDGFTEVFTKFGDSKVFEIAKSCCKHAACPVPTAILKGIEAECGLALIKDVNISITKE